MKAIEWLGRANAQVQLSQSDDIQPNRYIHGYVNSTCNRRCQFHKALHVFLPYSTCGAGLSNDSFGKNGQRGM